MTDAADVQAGRFATWRRPLVIVAGIAVGGLICGAGMAAAFFIHNEYPGLVGSIAAGVVIIATGLVVQIAARKLSRSKGP